MQVLGSKYFGIIAHRVVEPGLIVTEDGRNIMWHHLLPAYIDALNDRDFDEVKRLDQELRKIGIYVGFINGCHNILHMAPSGMKDGTPSAFDWADHMKGQTDQSEAE